MDEKSDILEQVEQLEKAASELSHRMYPYMVNQSPVEGTTAPAPHPRSVVYDRIGSVTNQLRDLSARLVP